VTIASSTTVEVARCRQRSTGEHVLPEGGRRAFSKLTDVTRMVVAGRRERTEPEYRQLFAAHGFRLTHLVPIGGDVSVIEARLA
jgi:hypothetical protein